MGLKFKRFKAKLNWKPKTTTPEVVCLTYRITSEFAELVTRAEPVALSTYTNDIRNDQEFNANKENNTAVTINHTTEVNYEQNNMKIEPLSENNLELNVSKINANNETASWQPKSILKKTTNNSPDLEEYKKSPLIFMTQDNDEEIINVSSKQVKPTLINTQEQEYLGFRSNLDNSDGKIVNWRNTIEFIDLKEGDSESNLKLFKKSSDIAEDKEESKVRINTHYRNGVTYSTQAASIFFTENSNACTDSPNC